MDERSPYRAMTEAIDEPGERDGRGREVAVSLMRMALPLLDRAGEPLAAARLQHALDALAPELRSRIAHASGADPI